MSRDERIRNLIKIGTFKEAARDPAAIGQFIGTAEKLLADAERVTSSQARFLLAYEGIHSLAMAVLNNFGLRAGDSEGHRINALQFAVQEMGLEAERPGSIKTVSEIHRIRNDKTYRHPIPPISEATARAGMQFLAIAVPRARVVCGSDQGPDDDADGPKMPEHPKG